MKLTCTKNGAFKNIGIQPNCAYTIYNDENANRCMTIDVRKPFMVDGVEYNCITIYYFHRNPSEFDEQIYKKKNLVYPSRMEDIVESMEYKTMLKWTQTIIRVNMNDMMQEFIPEHIKFEIENIKVEKYG